MRSRARRSTARDFARAREMLTPILTQRPTQKALILMAELEEAETGDRGRAREWLARAVRAPRDPAWTADGVVLEEWAPVSPVSGKLDAVEWKLPVAEIEGPRIEIDKAELAALPATIASGAREIESRRGERRGETRLSRRSGCQRASQGQRAGPARHPDDQDREGASRRALFRWSTRRSPTIPELSNPATIPKSGARRRLADGGRAWSRRASRARPRGWRPAMQRKLAGLAFR